MALETLLKVMAQNGASDLFITAGVPPRAKVNGRIRSLQQNSLSAEQVSRLVYGTMDEMQRDEFKTTMECNFAINAEGIGRFRVSAFIQRDTPGMVLRRVENQIPTLDSLDLPEGLAKLAMTERGLVLFVGATGTGKSTSLAAMVGHRNANADDHIICVEDPIEFVHPHLRSIVTQREVGIDTISYLIALKNALRQAPDVLMIGEVRQTETMEHALAFAETGHLCLTSLHASHASQALERIANFFPKDRRDQVLMDLSLNLKAIIGQQLVKRKDGEGQHVVLELLYNTPHVADLIRQGDFPKINEVMKRSREQGMLTFDQSLYELFEDNVIDEATALKHATSENDVRLMIKLSSTAEDMDSIHKSNMGVSLLAD